MICAPITRPFTGGDHLEIIFRARECPSSGLDEAIVYTNFHLGVFDCDCLAGSDEGAKVGRPRLMYSVNFSGLHVNGFVPRGLAPGLWRAEALGSDIRLRAFYSPL
jgi:hypothetical protein